MKEWGNGERGQVQAAHGVAACRGSAAPFLLRPSFFVVQNIREVKVLRRYHIQVREDYLKYNRMVGQIHQLLHRLQKLQPDDAYRISTTEQIMNKL